MEVMKHIVGLYKAFFGIEHFRDILQILMYVYCLLA